MPSQVVERETTNNPSFMDGNRNQSALKSQPKLENKGKYTMIGLCFVSRESQEQIQQMKEEILRKFMRLDYDSQWAKMFVILITYQENDIDLRL